MESKNLPSIFNDVIGPIMRGPSSSHTAASWRIAKTCLDILDEPLHSALIEFDKDGAWAPNYKEQGTTMGIEGGLLNLDISDPDMKKTELVAKNMNIPIQYAISSFKTDHANTVRLSLKGIHGKETQIIAVSLGGGSFEIRQINNFAVNIQGSYYELLIQTKENTVNTESIKQIFSGAVSIEQFQSSDEVLYTIKSNKSFPLNQFAELERLDARVGIIQINPIMPIILGNETGMPFTSISSLISYSKKENLHLGELGVIYEKSLSNLSSEELFQKMNEIVSVIESSIKTGLDGTTYNDRILHQQSHLIAKAKDQKKISGNQMINDLVANVTAIMESKSAMELIVANPTAGSAGTVGGAIKAIADDLKSSKQDIIDAYFAAGLVGAYFAQGPGFSAEEHGCQVETGAAAGMAAAGISQLFGGTAEQSINAASIAIQNIIGLVCDPVADRVEVPCLGKNISAAMNALSSATMACAGFDAVIPLNEVIDTVYKVSSQMPACVKCTGKGGLAITPASIALRNKLNQ